MVRLHRDKTREGCFALTSARARRQRPGSLLVVLSPRGSRCRVVSLARRAARSAPEDGDRTVRASIRDAECARAGRQARPAVARGCRARIVRPRCSRPRTRASYHHPGVDPIAMAARGSAKPCHTDARLGREHAHPAARADGRAAAAHVRGKWRELALALRIEVSALSKREILEEYLNRVEFGPDLRGIDAASRYYFDKPRPSSRSRRGRALGRDSARSDAL